MLRVFYFPALTIAIHEMVRLADFAVNMACEERSWKPNTFGDSITLLLSLRVIPNADEESWAKILEAREKANHPAGKYNYGPAEALKLLHLIPGMINRIDWLPAIPTVKEPEQVRLHLKRPVAGDFWITSSKAAKWSKN